MSRETLQWLNQNVKVGFTDPQYGRGIAWHYRADLQGDKPNHYPHAIPVQEVLDDLFFWEAIEAPVFIGIPTGEGFDYVADPNRKAIVRNDTNAVFSVFKSGYQIHSYRQWLIKDVANLLDESEIAIGTAGLLSNGAKAFVTIELPETVSTPMGFDIRPHILACTSHDGTLATTYQLVSTIVVCDNTLAGALGENTPKYKVRHSKNSIGRLQTVRDALQLVHDYSDDLTKELEHLAQQQVTDNQFQQIVANLIPLPESIDLSPRTKSRVENKQDVLRDLYKNDPRVAPWNGTALGVFQAWNTYNHHFFGADNRRVERNMLNGLNGKAEENDKRVLDLLKGMALV